jgi:hypothetical protein
MDGSNPAPPVLQTFNKTGRNKKSVNSTSTVPLLALKIAARQGMLGFGFKVTEPAALLDALPNAVVQIALAAINVFWIVEGETKLLAPAFKRILATRTPVSGVVCTCGHGFVGIVGDVQATPPTEPAGTENG